jgi:sulfite reductase alpha subunit-like flavoprotein
MNRLNKSKNVVDNLLNRLTELTTNKDLFIERVEKQQLGLIDIIEEFHKSLDLPLDAFFQVTDRLMPRYYTIASSSLKYPDEVRIAISLSVDKTDKFP